jgi:DNA invertase Pin-like site-specific DNA recombinase
MASKRKAVVTPVEQGELRVAAYLRVSTNEQAESGLGLDAQLRQVNGMAMAKGWLNLRSILTLA